MTLTLSELNALPDDRASSALGTCCGASRWVRGMLARRPFASRGAVLRAADELWREMGPDDWTEAFAHHPRIGEQAAAAIASERASTWSTAEQSGMSSAHDDIRAALAEGNREYERRFGFIYIVCATGRDADELLAILRGRLRNDRYTEMRVAAGEQRKITRLRLEKLLGAD